MVELLQYIDTYLSYIIPKVPILNLSNKRVHALAHAIGRDFAHSDCPKTMESVILYTKKYVKNHLVANMLQDQSAFLKFTTIFLPIYQKINSDIKVKESFSSRYYFWEAIFSGIFDTNFSKNVEDSISYFYHSYVMGTLSVNDDYLKYFKELYSDNYTDSVKIKMKRKNQYRVSFFDNFWGIEQDLILKILKRLRFIKPKYYNIIIKRHDESLQEWNVLNVQENAIYHGALHYIESVLEKDTQKWLETSVGDTLYSRHPNKPAYLIDDIVSFYQDFYPKRYQVLLKRHGKTFLEWNSLSPFENNLYSNTNVEIKRLLETCAKHYDAIKSFYREVSLKNPDVLSIIHLKRRRLDNNQIMAKFLISKEQLYQIFAENILFFGFQAPKIIFEILTSSLNGIHYLKLSEQFIYFLNMEFYSKEKIICLERYMFRDYPKIQKNFEAELLKLLKFKSLNEKNIQRISLEIDKSQMEKAVPHTKKFYSGARDFFTNFPSVDPRLITRVVERLKQTYPKYYAIIIERHEKSLLGWNTFSPQKSVIYYQALEKVTEILKRDDLEAWLHDEIKDNFFTRLPNHSELFLKQIFPSYQILKPQHYNIVIARHGKDLKSFHTLEGSVQNNQYRAAMNYFERAFCKMEDDIPEFQKLLKDALRENKMAIPFIQDRRKGMKVCEISKKYQIDSEEIYCLFAKCLFAFGYDMVYMIQEILTNSAHGMEYLAQSKQFQRLLKRRYLNHQNMMNVPKNMFPTDVSYQEYLQIELEKCLTRK